MTAARFATVTGTEPLRGVVVGAGQLGPYWARELLEHPDVELVGWVDIDAERAAAAADALALEDVPTGSALEDMLDAQRPDFVVNVTAPDAHHAVTIGALDRSVAVLSEKPMAATMAAALDMVAAADRAERLFMVSQNRRYMPELVAFRETVGRLGQLSSISCDFYLGFRKDAPSFLFRFAQPLLLDMAIHLFDGARALTGADPLSVYCDAYNPPWSWYDGPAAAHAVFRLSGGVRFAFDGNWAADGADTSWTGSWRAVGEHGTATWDGKGVPHVHPGPGARIAASVPIPAPRVEGRFLGLEGALNDFVAALRTGTVPQGECHDNLRSLAMCHAAVESAALGEPVRVLDRIAEVRR